MLAWAWRQMAVARGSRPCPRGNSVRRNTSSCGTHRARILLRGPKCPLDAAPSGLEREVRARQDDAWQSSQQVRLDSEPRPEQSELRRPDVPFVPEYS